MKILFLTTYIPFPLTSGGQIRTWNMLKRLATQHEVTLVCFSPRVEALEYCDTIRKTVKGFYWVEHDGLFSTRKILTMLFQGIPLNILRYHNQDLVNLIQRLTANIQFDIVYFDHLHVAQYGKYLSACKFSVLDEHNAEHLVLERCACLNVLPYFKRIAMSWQAKLLKSYEAKIVKRVDLALTVSDADAKLLRQISGVSDITVVPNGVDPDFFTLLNDQPSAPTLLYLGSLEWLPNQDAVLYFVKEIWPDVISAIPTIRLIVAGRNPPQRIQELESGNISIIANPEDVREIYKMATAVIVPLRAGGGSRLKILEAMAIGKVVISTKIGCEGLEVQDREHLFIINSEEDWVRMINEVISNSPLCRKIIIKARELVVKKYSWDGIFHDFYYRFLKKYQSNGAKDIAIEASKSHKKSCNIF